MKPPAFSVSGTVACDRRPVASFLTGASPPVPCRAATRDLSLSTGPGNDHLEVGFFIPYVCVAKGGPGSSERATKS